MRPLTLHVSALSDVEYDLYTASLNDLAPVSTNQDNLNNIPTTTHARDDAHYERTSVGVREVRAWLRGRYPNLSASDIDSILRLFCPNMLPSDTLTGGQFFAALRLVLHAGSGKGVDRTLAFVQASPKPTRPPDFPQSLSPPKRPVQAPPSHPDRQKLPPLVNPSSETNPFSRRQIDHGLPPAPPIDPDLFPQQRPYKISHNPFLVHDSSVDKTAPPANTSNQGKLPPLPPRKPTLLAAPPRRLSDVVPTPITSTAHIMTPSGPPLIPIKPTHVMSPLMRQSLEASKHAQSIKRAEEQLDRERVCQILKTTSSSSSGSNTTPGTRTRSLSPTKQYQVAANGHAHDSRSGESDDGTTYVPPLPGRRKPSIPSSTTSSSVLSLEQVASATLPSPPWRPPRPPLPSRDALGVSTTHVEHAVAPASLGPIPPPTHPHRQASTSTDPTVNDTQSSAPSSPRVMRSRSVTASSSSSAPLPPPRRKRPESMQLGFTPDGGGGREVLNAHNATLPPHVLSAPGHGRTASLQGLGLSRHHSLTLSRGLERELAETAPSVSPSPIAHIQKTLTHLQLRAQPKLDAVRYKAEAGLSRRGYVHHGHLSVGGARWKEEGEEGLMADAMRWTNGRVGRNDREGGTDCMSESTTDEDASSGEGVDQEHRHRHGHRHDGRQGSTTTRRGGGTTTTLMAPGPGAAPYRDFLTESDNLKWPMGEGWKPL